MSIAHGGSLARRMLPAALIAWSGSAAQTTSPHVPDVIVGPNVQVSRAYAAITQTEGLIAADPSDPMRLLGCTMMYSDADGAMIVVAYLSVDGGKSWRPTLRTDPKRYVMDPTCAYGADGTAYLVTAPRYGARGMWLQRSYDGGATWDSAGTMESLDRQYVVVDNTPGRSRSRIYVHGSGVVRALDGDEYVDDLTLYSSSDGGRTFRGVRRAALGDRAVLGVGNGIVLSDGTWIGVFGEMRKRASAERAGEEGPEATPARANAWLRTAISPDGGQSLNPGATVDDWHMPWPPFASSVVPYIATDAGSAAFRDRLYVVWPDGRSGHVEIRFAYSADKGRTWSKSIALNDEPPARRPEDARDHLMPMLAVNASGVVGVAWQDRRDAADNLGWSVRFRASLDGGETFLPSVRVSEKDAVFGGADRWSIHRSVEQGRADGTSRGTVTVRLSMLGFLYSGGHTSGMAADAAGTFHPYWVDNRTGIHQVWTAPVTVRGAALKNGRRDLAELVDVSSKVTLDVTNMRFDRANDMLTVTARLRNTSADTIRGPVKLRILTLQSDVGVAEVRSADGDDSRGGTVFDFTPSTAGGALPPSATTGERRLAFQVKGLRPFRQGKELRFGLLSFDARVLAGGPPAGVASAR